MDNPKIHFNICKGKMYPLGATVVSDGIQFCATLTEDDDCGVELIEIATGQIARIPFCEGLRMGNIASLIVKNISVYDYDYRFYCKTYSYLDPYARKIKGNEEWGQVKTAGTLRCGFASRFDEWEEDEPLCIPFDDSTLYCLHVRGFTKHASSKVKHKGTFAGIVDKISYLKELGITGIELLPAYEFEESLASSNDCAPALDYHFVDETLKFVDESSPRVNYWGFQKGFYFAPKESYCAGSDAGIEFKRMVKSLHQNGIEVIMQFYFPDDCKQGFIYDVVKYWIMDYHIDGVHLKGNKIPITLLATEPLFANTKIMYDYIPENEIYGYADLPAYKNLCVYSDQFMYQMRRFLKGDEDQLSSMLRLIKEKPEKVALVHFITNYYGFTLMDLVSYDRKHNEDNGEKNLDGADYNFSWNCGTEGKSKKPAVVSLRKRMMKNALMLVFLAQGTPLLLSGDEFMNSQEGNNNPYCQDNDVTWLNWNTNKAAKEMFEFTKALIHFRKNRPFLHEKKEMTMLDLHQCGYPDLSYHSEDAWKAQLENYNRHVGVMYCEYNQEHKLVELVYVAYNMFWEKKIFALPKLAKSKQWSCVISSGNVTEKIDEKRSMQSFEMEDRSIAVFVSEQKDTSLYIDATMEGNEHKIQ